MNNVVARIPAAFRVVRSEWKAVRRRWDRGEYYTGRHDPERLTMGRESYGDPDVLTIGDPDAKVVIGSFCSIADGVTFLLGGGHHTNWVTTCPYILGRAAAHHPPIAGDIVIGHDVWLGRSVTVMEGVTIGTGAVVGAHALVTKDVAPYMIVGGNPIREIRRRFPDQVCDELLASKWWTWSDEMLAERLDLLWSPRVDDFLRSR